MKNIRASQNQKICPKITHIYRLILKDGYKIAASVSPIPWHDEVFVKLWDTKSKYKLERTWILYPCDSPTHDNCEYNL